METSGQGEEWKRNPTLVEYIFDRLALAPDKASPLYLHLRKCASWTRRSIPPFEINVLKRQNTDLGVDLEKRIRGSFVYTTFLIFFRNHTDGWKSRDAKVFTNELAAGQELALGRYIDLDVIQFRNNGDIRNLFFATDYSAKPALSGDFQVTRHYPSLGYYEVKQPENFNPSLFQEQYTVTGFTGTIPDSLMEGI